MAKINLNSPMDIRTAIQRRANEISMQLTNKEIFQSFAFQNYASKIVDFILRKHRLYKLTFIHDERPNSPTAFTDGKNITVNTGNILVTAAKTLEKRFQSAMGLLFHEASHKLFMDFDFTFDALHKIEAGELVGSFDTTIHPELATAHSELEGAVSTSYRSAIASIYAELVNIVNDGHDEKTLKRCFPGFVTQCIDAMDETQRMLAPTLDESIESGASDFKLYMQLLLDYCVFGIYKVIPGSEQASPYLEQMHIFEPVVDLALAEDDCCKRWDHLNTLILYLWPYIREQLNPQQTGAPQGNDPSGSDCNNQFQLTPEQAQEIFQQMFQEMRQDNFTASMPQNCNGNPISAGQLSISVHGPGDAKDIDQIIRSISTQMATSAVQQELDELQMAMLRNVDLPLIHRKTKVDIHRHFEPEEIRYERILSRMKPHLKRLTQKTRLLLDDLNDDSLQTHRNHGPIIYSRDLYRIDTDGTFFAKRNLPADVPSMAICILMDVSVSMRGPKLEYSKDTAILIERYANAFDIPVMIATHNVTLVGHVNLNVYTDFTSTMPDNDRYALAGIDVAGRNRDGIPLRYCCELLLKRPEDVKLMIVLSDGTPNDSNYKGSAARDDIRSAVAHYRRKGLTIFGAAIDKDKPIIKEIYGEHFLDISNIETLPNTLTRVISQLMT